MFSHVARLVQRFWIPLLVVWISLFALLSWQAPHWESVAEEGEFKFLPPDSPTRRGERLLENAFPAERDKSSIVILFTRSGGEPLTDSDKSFIADVLKPRIQQLSLQPPSPTSEPTSAGSEPLILAVETWADSTTGPLLLSPDGRATLVNIELATGFLDSPSRRVVDRVEELLATLKDNGELPAGLDVALTGSAVVGRDQIRAKARSAENIHAWTIWLVVGLLLLVYRAPVLALIPLATLFVAVQITLKFTALLAGAGYLNVFDGQEIYTTVIVYGAGVDFSLFVLSRYQEELQNGLGVKDAVGEAIRRVGNAVAASATTQIFGIGMLIFMSFRKFQQAGFSISLGFFLMLLASLLLTPALLCLAGRAAFWPFALSKAPVGNGHTGNPSRPGRNVIWSAVAAILRKHPGTAWTVTVLLLLPLAVAGARNADRLSYGIVSELPPEAPSLHGTRRLAQFFPAGKSGTLTLLLRNDKIDFSAGSAESAIQTFTQNLWSRRDELNIADIRSLAQPRGFHADTGGAPAEATVAQSLLRRGERRRQAIEHYVSHGEQLDARVTRLRIVLTTDPFARETIDHLDTLETAVGQALPASLSGSTTYLLGSTANLRDLKTVAENDRARIHLLVTSVVLLILIIMLRRIAVPLYLILTVLFSFFVTMGATFLVFQWWEGEHFAGLDWTVPIFLFTLLIAVGEDYNIFLVSRVDEEQQRHGPLRGVTEALSRTGGIISGCGVIMAGTFASLLVGGELAGMRQLGFALSCGVLLDTFVVRTILVPSYLLLVNDGRLGALSPWLGGITPREAQDKRSEP